MLSGAFGAAASPFGQKIGAYCVGINSGFGGDGIFSIGPDSYDLQGMHWDWYGKPGPYFLIGHWSDNSTDDNGTAIILLGPTPVTSTGGCENPADPQTFAALRAKVILL